MDDMPVMTKLNEDVDVINAYLAIDWGGTAIKHGLVSGEGSLLTQGSMPTPDNLAALYEIMGEIKAHYQKEFRLLGVGISAPGAVNNASGVIGGITALPYIHHFDIVTPLREIFDLPVAIINDANAAALAEGWQGAAKGIPNYATVVIGTGIGGGMVQNGQLITGTHQLAGEWGYWILNGDTGDIWSDVGATRPLTDAASTLLGRRIDGKELFALAQQGDASLQALLDRFYRYNAQGIYNLQHSFDPGLILIGGGVSRQPVVIEGINSQLALICKSRGHISIVVRACQHFNDANLLGAVYFLLQQLNDEASSHQPGLSTESA